MFLELHRTSIIYNIKYTLWVQLYCVYLPITKTNPVYYRQRKSTITWRFRPRRYLWSKCNVTFRNCSGNTPPRTCTITYENLVIVRGGCEICIALELILYRQRSDNISFVNAPSGDDIVPRGMGYEIKCTMWKVQLYFTCSAIKRIVLNQANSHICSMSETLWSTLLERK